MMFGKLDYGKSKIRSVCYVLIVVILLVLFMYNSNITSTIESESWNARHAHQQIKQDDTNSSGDQDTMTKSYEKYFVENDRVISSFPKHCARGPKPWNNTELSSLSKDLQKMLDLPIPRQFHLDFMNPCWYSSAGTVRCLPYFFLIGFPKCASTDLYHKMALHPRIQPNKIKEPSWWNRERYKGIFCDVSTCKNNTMSFDTYLSNFNMSLGLEKLKANMNISKPIPLITGDASISTAWDNGPWPQLPGNQDADEPRVITAHHIRHYLPDSKIIVIMRDPVESGHQRSILVRPSFFQMLDRTTDWWITSTEQMFSDFLYFWEGMTPPTAEIFHERMAIAVERMNSCQMNHTVRACVHKRSTNMFRLHIGMYSVYIKDWFAVFNRSQIHILRTEDYMERPFCELNKLFSFLGLDKLPGSASKQIKSSQKLVTRKASVEHVHMLPETRQLLRDFYRPYNQELADILDNQKFLWETDSLLPCGKTENTKAGNVQSNQH